MQHNSKHHADVKVVFPKYSIDFSMTLVGDRYLLIKFQKYEIETDVESLAQGQQLLKHYQSMFPKAERGFTDHQHFSDYLLEVQNAIFELEYLRGEDYGHVRFNYHLTGQAEMDQIHNVFQKFSHQSKAEITKQTREFRRVEKQLNALSPFEQRLEEEKTQRMLNQDLDE